MVAPHVQGVASTDHVARQGRVELLHAVRDRAAAEAREALRRVIAEHDERRGLPPSQHDRRATRRAVGDQQQHRHAVQDAGRHDPHGRGIRHEPHRRPSRPRTGPSRTSRYRHSVRDCEASSNSCQGCWSSDGIGMRTRSNGRPSLPRGTNATASTAPKTEAVQGTAPGRAARSRPTPRRRTRRAARRTAARGTAPTGRASTAPGGCGRTGRGRRGRRAAPTTAPGRPSTPRPGCARGAATA